MSKTVEYWCQAMRKTYGLIDHYFMVIDDNEYHAGTYKPGKILPRNTTKGAHLVSVCNVCEACYHKILLDYDLKEDDRLFTTYFPLLNCESVCTGISVQSIALIAVPFICLLIINGKFLWALILLLFVVVSLLAYSKYKFSRTTRTSCVHYNNNNNNN